MENNFEVQDEKIEKTLRELGKAIGDQVPGGYGFTLFLFDFGDKGNMFYISNSQREDMLKAMKEFIEKQEQS